MNRVYTLYRVSTKGQVEKDDIPMQRISCQEFADRQGWEIQREFSEKGVSGYKVSSEKRDAIQQIKADADKGKFDVLLVYAFDRLGRREDKTPFVVQWFINRGIRIWSVNEGEARIENHVDKLMNYIRFWQASGESEKTSVRVKTRLAQLTEEGHYTGGACPYGYELYHNGRLSRKETPCLDLRINEIEAETVKTIFRKTVEEGYGSYRLACYLNSLSIPTKTGGEWLAHTVMGVLTRQTYIGYLVNGDSRSMHLPHLQIVDDDTFQTAQNIVASRRANNTIQRHVPYTTIGKTLLSGLIYCGTCGARMVITTSGKGRTNANGEYIKGQVIKYACYQRTKKQRTCDGQTAFLIEKVDKAVTEVLRQLFSKIKAFSLENAVMAKLETQNKQLVQQQGTLRAEITKTQSAVSTLENEIVKVLQGDSVFTAETINKLVSEHRAKILGLENDLRQIEQKLDEKQDHVDSLSAEFMKISNWATVYDEASLSAKKMIAAHLIDRIVIARGYQMEIFFNLTLEQFNLGMTSKKIEAVAV
jgi:DNA invertase Pin-like site-specific DNA recombinase